MTEHQDRKNLGRGLSSLLGDLSLQAEKRMGSDSTGSRFGQQIPIEKLKPNPSQPRQHFDLADLEELAASIRAGGIIQPLIVRPSSDNGDEYIIVAGERRWRAAQQARLHEIPVIIRNFTESESLQVALVENIQRTDLNPMEEASAFRQLMNQFGHTQEELSASLGRSRSAIANLLRLLTLPDEVQELVRSRILSAGHARALVGAENALALARQVVNLNLSVRQTEELVKKAGREPNLEFRRRGKDANTRVLEASLSSALNAKVSLDLSGSGEDGKIVVKFKDLNHLDRLCKLFNSAGADLRKEL